MGLSTEVTKKIQSPIKECLKTGGNGCFFDVSEEEIKMVKHIGEKVPEETNIWCYQAPSNSKKIVI
jgi:hypothetical protein